MNLQLTPGGISNWSSGIALIVLGLLILRLRPRRKPNVYFAAFSASFGAAFVAWNILDDQDPLSPATRLAVAMALVVAAAAMAAVALHFPAELSRRERRHAWAGAGLGAAFVALSTAAVASDLTTFIALSPREHLGPEAYLALYGSVLALAGVLWGVCFLLALRFAAAEDARLRRQYALTCAALSLYPGYIAGAGGLIGTSIIVGREGPVALGVVGIGFALGLASLWVRNAARAPDAHLSRNLAILSAGLPLAGMVDWAFEWWGGWGVARMVGVALLAYAILRHQLLGLDLKVKWTVKQSTVAAAFVGVFFIVSESASTFLATSGLGPYLGIAAAGLLVFALAPLQRVAEKVASTAMPGVRSPAEMGRDERLELYREQLRIAWSDGALSQDERRLLAGTRAKLGISAEDALRAEQEVAP